MTINLIQKRKLWNVTLDHRSHHLGDRIAGRIQRNRRRPVLRDGLLRRRRLRSHHCGVSNPALTWTNLTFWTARLPGRAAFFAERLDEQNLASQRDATGTSRQSL